jgi:conjugal transfer pilus assembly protein TraW
MNIKKGMKRYTGIILIIFTAISPQIVQAKDLGTVGQTYSIIEEDFLVFIQNRIKLMQQNGEWQRLQNQFSEDVAKHADRPHALDRIGNTTHDRTWYFDPSITIPYDLTDQGGRIFAKSGTTINPLKFISLHKALLFFDGDNAKHIEWAKKIDLELKGKIKIILVRGSIIENEKRFSKPIYFDQEGRLTTRFQISHVPALVRQEGEKLIISEIVP